MKDFGCFCAGYAICIGSLHFIAVSKFILGCLRIVGLLDGLKKQKTYNIIPKRPLRRPTITKHHKQNEVCWMAYETFAFPSCALHRSCEAALSVELPKELQLNGHPQNVDTSASQLPLDILLAMGPTNSHVKKKKT